ncbi:hypothetical protein XENTR_v10022886 [Xenopus tropicalis]|nr:hypothetical protein XENTR_v10022886 [Xenopus tropicalis]
MPAVPCVCFTSAPLHSGIHGALPGALTGVAMKRLVPPYLYHDPPFCLGPDSCQRSGHWGATGTAGTPPMQYGSRDGTVDGTWVLLAPPTQLERGRQNLPDLFPIVLLAE